MPALSAAEARRSRADPRPIPAAAWLGLVVLFVGYRVAMVVGDPSRFWGVEECYQADIALAIARGQPLEALPSYLYPYFAGGSLVDGLLVAGLASVFGPTWWVLKGLALGWALAATATLVLGVRAAVGPRPALALLALLAMASPSTASLQMFLYGNHAEAALPLALAAVGTWALLEGRGGPGRDAALALGLGLLGGLGVFFVYSHLIVVGLQAAALLVCARPVRDKLRWAALGAVGLCGGLLPWVACRRFFDQPLMFRTDRGGADEILLRAFSGEGLARIGEVLAVVPWLGRASGRPWLELVAPSLGQLGAVALWGARGVLLGSLVGAVVLAGRRRGRGTPGWVLPGAFGIHGLLLIPLLAGAAAEPRYAQQMTTDAVVCLVLLVSAARGTPGRVAGRAAVAGLLALAAVDALAVLHPPAPGLALLAAEAPRRFSRTRQDQQLNGFTRDELPGIAAWLGSRPSGEADAGFALAFVDAAKPLERRHGPSRPDRIEVEWLNTWLPDQEHDRPALLLGFGAAALVRSGGDVDRALAIFDGAAEDRAPYREGVEWMKARLGP